MQRDIRREIEEKSALGTERLSEMITAGKSDEGAEYFLFFREPSGWLAELTRLTDELADGFAGMTPGSRDSFLRFLVRLRLDLDSLLSSWHLRGRVSDDDLKEAVSRAAALLRRFSFEKEAETLLRAFEADAVLRLRAEGLDEEEARSLAAAEHTGTLAEWCEAEAGRGSAGNLIEIARSFQAGTSHTMLGNDYADFLLHTMRQGFCFQTTNPPLVKMAWDAKPGFWRERLGEYTDLYGGTPESDEERVMLMTMAVVGHSCRLLRPLFLRSGGRVGYVCYQVNPLKHDDHEAMTAEALKVHALFGELFEGVPNVSFKLPGTASGLKTAESLSRQGISLTITLSFAAFQTLEFAKVLQEGSALFSSVVVMNGRLAFPVRDELLAAGVPGAEKASELAGVEVTRQIYRRMYRPAGEGGLGIDPGKVKILNASLRIYGGRIPDLDEIWGSPAITIFPNVRRAYDAVGREFSPETVRNETPREAMEVLAQSELFRQAWWTPGEDEKLRPKAPLSLEAADAARVVAWQPIADTLSQFIAAWGETRAKAEQLF
jgi:transaldolase